ncbi:carbohydrate ABC transporter permease [Paenibacillus sp. J5C_2022]|nr:carbohydrate ABC transporter permease [Paenibacillus sp. J5C2022]
MTVIMAVFGLVFLLPFVWMLSASLKSELEVFQYPIQWIPEAFRWSNYSEVWNGDHPFTQYYWNSIKVSAATTVLSVTISCLAAYGFTKMRFPGRDLLFIIVLVTYMIPPQAILVPQFIMYKFLGLFDSHLGLVLLNSFSVLGTFLLRQFFLSVHNEFMESAKMDGAGHFRIFRSIALPLVLPAIATYGILRFIWTWNDYQGPLIFLRSDLLFTIQLGIRKFADVNGEFYSLIMAGAVSAILPLLLIFIVGQRFIMEGIAAGGVKG